jgi:fido (protein-threonine AMPylation protein)
MTLTPGCGETPISDEEAESLLPNTRELLGEPISKAAMYDLEQAVQEEVAEHLLTEVLNDTVTLGELLSDRFLRELHRQMYGDIWTWAGAIPQA